ncbi:hypothetical protein ACA910_014341 [Epithemia clementina (nom. ined.)]
MSTKTTRDNDHDDHHDCLRWAAQWSQHYRNTERYIPPNVVTTTTTRTSLSSSWLSLFLKRYLSTHGLLVTMCASLNSWQACILPTPMTHWSASWINAYFLSSNDNNNNSSSSSSRSDPQSLLFPTTSQVGMILDPKKVHIRCLYPTDGNTQFRSAQGCGPVEGGGVGAGKVGGGMGRTMQRPFPSLPSSSSSTMRDLILQHKNLNFGVDTPWTDIDCQDFFPMVGGVAGRDQLSLLWHWANQKNTTTANTTTTTTTTTSSSFSAANRSNNDHHHHRIIQGAYEYVQEQYAHIMGHDVCNAMVRGRQTHGIYYVYTDQDSWNVPALDWQTVMDYQWQIIQNNDSSRSSQPQSLSSSSMSSMSSPYSVKAHFNEIVMDLPLPQLQNVVLAVFYIVDDNNDSQEQREARRKLAHAQARILGNKIVLQMSTTGSTTTTNNNNNLPDLLTCDDDDYDDDYDDNHNNHKDRPSEGGSQVSSTV